MIRRKLNIFFGSPLWNGKSKFCQNNFVLIKMQNVVFNVKMDITLLNTLCNEKLNFAKIPIFYLLKYFLKC
jgi:hypothetical protein